MSLVTRNPNRNAVSPLDVWNKDFDTFVSRVFGPTGSGNAGFAVDVYEDGDHLHVDAELPGFTREQVDVTVDNRVLTITAERSTVLPQRDSGVSDEQQTDQPQQVEDGRPSYYVRERTARRVSRSFTLPDTIDTSNVDARLTDGVLYLTLNKRQEVKPRKISIG